MAQHQAEQIFYRVHYKSPSCYDDGDMTHDQWWADEAGEFPAANDAEARAIANRDYRRPEACYHGRTAFLTKLERVSRCADRIAEVPLLAG
jgi:hypothetical protein